MHKHAISLITLSILTKSLFNPAIAASSVISTGNYNYLLNYSDDYVINANTVLNSNSTIHDTLSINDSTQAANGPIDSISLHNNGAINNGVNDNNLAAVSFFTKHGKLDNNGNINGWDFSVIMSGAKGEIINNGQIIANNGVALLSFNDQTSLVNYGIIHGATTAIDAENTQAVEITNQGNISSQQQAAVILNHDSQLTNAGIITSQSAAAVLLMGSGNTVTLTSDSILRGGSNVALLSGAENNHLILQGSGSESGDFTADADAHALSSISSSANSRWALNGNITAWGTRDDVISIAGQLQLAGKTLIAGGGGATVQPGGRLLLINGGTLTGNLINNGEISINPAKEVHGNPFVINGNYTGHAHSLLTFSGALGDDYSAVDSLVINGNTAGSTAVQVINVGGNGAQTQNGIELIKVNGNSASNAFVQQGRIVAGSYDYFLHQGKPGEANDPNWYLRSSLPAAAPLVIPFTTPQATSAILRPEAGAYAANMAASNKLFMLRLQDRLNATQSGSTFWLRQTGTHQHSQAGTQLSQHSNQYVMQMGADLFALQAGENGALHIGVMAGYGNNRGTTTSRISGYQSNNTLSGYSGGISATWYADEAQRLGLYSDNWLQYSGFDNSIKGDDLPVQRWHSQGVTAASEWGYRAMFSVNPHTDLLLQPQLQVAWMDVNAAPHQEENGSKIATSGRGNFATLIGFRAELQTSALFTPYLELNALHNSHAFGSRLNDDVVEIDGTRQLGEVKLGMQMALPAAWEMSLEATAQRGGNHYQNVGGALVLKAHF